MKQKDDYLIELSKFESKIIDSYAKFGSTDNSYNATVLFFKIAVYQRALDLNRGYLLLTKDDNYYCAIPLVRLQLDNILRFYCLSLVSDLHDFLIHVLNKKGIRNYKDTSGNKLTDAYLVKMITKKYPLIESIYKDLSSHIHLSDTHFYALKREPQENGSLIINIGESENNFSDELKSDINNIMNAISNLLIKLIEDKLSTTPM